MTACIVFGLIGFFLLWTLLSLFPRSTRQPVIELYLHSKEFLELAEKSSENSRSAIWSRIQGALAYQNLTTSYHVCCSVVASIFCCLVCWVIFTSELYLSAATLFSMGFGDANAAPPNFGLHNQGALAIVSSAAFWAMILTDLIGLTHFLDWNRLHPYAWWVVLATSVLCVLAGFSIMGGFGLYRADAVDATVELLPLTPEAAQQIQSDLVIRQQTVTRYCLAGMAGLGYLTAAGAAIGIFLGLQYPIYFLFAVFAFCLLLTEWGFRLVRYFILGIFGFVISFLNLFLRIGGIWAKPLGRTLHLREPEYDDDTASGQPTVSDWPEPERAAEDLPQPASTESTDTSSANERHSNAWWDPYGINSAN